MDLLFLFPFARTKTKTGNQKVSCSFFHKLLFSHSLKNKSVLLDAAECIGQDYASSPFWEKYLEFESQNGENGKVSEIYTRIIRIPLNNLSSFYERFVAHAFERPFSDFTESKLAFEGINLHSQSIEQQKREFMTIYEQIYNQTNNKLEQIKKYEEIISSRSYFHNKEQTEEHLQNWHNYLDFELSQKENDHNRVVSLFERCLIACV